VAGRRQVGGRGTARRLLACAVLAGLFLMHGSPFGAAEGCHGAAAAPAGMSVPAAAMALNGPVAAAHQHPGSARTGALPAMRGQLCVSTPARPRLALPAGGPLLTVAVLPAAVLLASGLLLGGPRARRRGPPPPGGRPLLLQMCVART
jgi:hypothetical protein